MNVNLYFHQTSSNYFYKGSFKGFSVVEISSNSNVTGPSFYIFTIIYS